MRSSRLELLRATWAAQQRIAWASVQECHPRATIQHVALIAPGLSRCAACDRVLTEGDDVIGLTQFSRSPDDPLDRFSDAPFHKACWVSLPERPQIEEQIRALGLERWHQFD